MMGIARPAGWDKVVEFAEGPRTSYADLRELKTDRAAARAAMEEFIRNCRFENCTPQKSYIRSISLKCD